MFDSGAGLGNRFTENFRMILNTPSVMANKALKANSLSSASVEVHGLQYFCKLRSTTGTALVNPPFAVEMKTTSGSGMRSAGETLRKVGTKRSELRQSEPGVGSNENLKVSEKRRDIRKVCSKEDRWTGRDRRPAYEGGPEGDVCRAFLATSECRGGPRPIRICAAARHLSTPIDSAQGEGAEAASAVTCDLRWVPHY